MTDASDARDEVIEVTVEDIVFRSDDSRFVVARVARTSASPDVADFTAVGDLGGVAVGETLRLRGRFTTHRTYGARFQIASFAPSMPETTQGIARYLGSGLVPGIGPGLADRLVKRFGQRTLDVIATQSARLSELPGI